MEVAGSVGSRKTPPRTSTVTAEWPKTVLSSAQDTLAKNPSPHTPQVPPASPADGSSSAVRVEFTIEVFAGRLSPTGSRQVNS